MPSAEREDHQDGYVDVGHLQRHVAERLERRAYGDLEEKREAIKRVRDCKDIVHGWDDPNDFSWWKDAFKILKPPSAREIDGGNGDD